jgi:hypothetical protein
MTQKRSIPRVRDLKSAKETAEKTEERATRDSWLTMARTRRGRKLYRMCASPPFSSRQRRAADLAATIHNAFAIAMEAQRISNFNLAFFNFYFAFLERKRAYGNTPLQFCGQQERAGRPRPYKEQQWPRAYGHRALQFAINSIHAHKDTENIRFEFCISQFSFCISGEKKGVWHYAPAIQWLNTGRDKPCAYSAGNNCVLTALRLIQHTNWGTKEQKL